MSDGLGYCSERIEYDDVTFGYEGEETVLDGVDFAVESGETVALVSATGAGKSTVAKLLLRLYDVDGSLAPVRQSESLCDSDDVDDAAVRVDDTTCATFVPRTSASRSATRVRTRSRSTGPSPRTSATGGSTRRWRR